MNDETGVNRWNYRRLGQCRLLAGVYAPVIAPTGNAGEDRRANWLAKVRAVLAVYADKHPVLYGPTALQALGVALPTHAEEWNVIHIMVDQAAERPQRNGIVAHSGLRGRPQQVTADGLPVLHPVDHWLQMRGLSDDAMVQIGDGLLRRHNPLLSLKGMQARLSALSGTPGAKQAKRVMKLIRPGTDSIYETKTRLVLFHHGMGTPHVNPTIWCPMVGATYHVDMGYLSAKLAIEYDGLVHIGSKSQMDFDAIRRRHLQDAGWLIITVTASQLRHPGEFVRSVENALVLRTSSGGSAA